MQYKVPCYAVNNIYRTALIKKENFPHIQGNSEWGSCKVIYEEGLPTTVHEEMRKYFPIYCMRRPLVIYDFASLQLLHSECPYI
jgi:hypothetical protein